MGVAGLEVLSKPSSVLLLRLSCNNSGIIPKKFWATGALPGPGVVDGVGGCSDEVPL